MATKCIGVVYVKTGSRAKIKSAKISSFSQKVTKSEAVIFKGGDLIDWQCTVYIAYTYLVSTH